MSRVIPAFAQFFDNAGDPLENGWIRFLNSGTNNSDKDTYADAALTVKNSNPLQLDAAGRCPDAFGIGLYRCVLYENNPVTHAPGTMVVPADPVSAEDTYPSAANYFSEWASTITYNQDNIVVYNRIYYKSTIDDNLNYAPDTNEDKWQPIKFFNKYDEYTSYDDSAIVYYDYKIYFSLVSSNLGNQPDISPTKWEPVASGTVLLNWSESGTSFVPDITGYDLGDPTNLIGDIYQVDNGKYYLGSDQDASIYHNGSNMFILNGTGVLGIGTTVATDLTFRTNNTIRWSVVSAGHLIPQVASTYDIGSSSKHTGDIYQGDSKRLYLGDDQDAYLTFNGSHFNISATSGDVNLKSELGAIALYAVGAFRWIFSETDMYPQDDTTYSLGKSTNNLKDIYQGDNGKHYFGSDQDASIYHDGTNFYINSSTGTIAISTGGTARWIVAAGGNIYPFAANAYDIGTAAYEIRNIYMGNSGKFYLGSDQDASIYHNGSHLFVGTESAQNIYFYTNNTNRWIMNSSGHIGPAADATYNIGTDTLGVQHVYQADNGKHYLGDDQDAEIYWDGTYLHLDGQYKHVAISVFASDVSVATGDGTYFITIPAELNGWNLVDVTAAVDTAGSANTTDIQVRRTRSSTDADMLSTKVTISASAYYAADGVINTSNDDVNTGDRIFIDVDAISTGTQGLTVTLTFQKP